MHVTIPRPEHPRPDAFRTNWLNLNGHWQFEIDYREDGISRGLIGGQNLATTILVPFCPESHLSGLGLGNREKFKQAWYRRFFSIPESMAGHRLRLHFGGVDYQAWIYLNGKFIGTHAGESAAFCFEITEFCHQAENELVVRVLDDMERGLQPKGKQAPDQSEGCVYTRTTGIWQTVWLEAVGASFIETFSVVTDPDKGRAAITLKINGSDPKLTVRAEAFHAGKSVAVESTPASGGSSWRLVLPIPDPLLWQPGTPHLYELNLSLLTGETTLDEVQSYFGLRKITVEGRRVLINGQPIFQRLILDQGFYPEGIWTAPSDEALVRDIELSMAAGFNGARLHQKVFEPRFLYHADRLGYLVWGEFPNWGLSYEPDSYADLINQWMSILIRDGNHPALIGWCPFNETKPNSGEIQQLIWALTRTVDPTRPVLETSGWHHFLDEPDLLDAHDYDQNPQTFRARWNAFFESGPKRPNLPARYGISATAIQDRGVPFFLSEFGGIGWAAEGGWGYGTGPATLEDFYQRYQGLVDAQLDNPNFFGFCYTQLTDIEQEKNGLFFYDRTSKFDLNRIFAITSRKAACERGEAEALLPEMPSRPQWRVLVGGEADAPLTALYRYITTSAPDNWFTPDFDDSTWTAGQPPFGLPESKSKTIWSDGDIYLRHTFSHLADKLGFSSACLVLACDIKASVYLNGTLLPTVAPEKGWTCHDITTELKQTLKPGLNYLATHASQAAKSHPFDLALLIA